MPSEEKLSSSEQIQLAGYQIWERVEKRLWGRVRLIVGLLVVGFGLVAFLGVPLVRGHIRDQVLEEARRTILSEIAEIEANKIDVATLRQEIRGDTNALKQQWLESQVDLELRLDSLNRNARGIEKTFARIDDENKNLEVLKGQVKILHRTLSSESDRMATLRQRYESELEAFKQDAQRTKANVSNKLGAELARMNGTIERDLDELRLILADHTAGVPAMFSSFVDLDKRSAEITGTNFGDEPGRVFLRVRTFAPTGDKPLAESESILVPPSTWEDTRIDLKISTGVLEKVETAKRDAASEIADAQFRYGFLVQTADGKMSQWSGKRVDSIVPPSRMTDTN